MNDCIPMSIAFLTHWSHWTDLQIWRPIRGIMSFAFVIYSEVHLALHTTNESTLDIRGIVGSRISMLWRCKLSWMNCWYSSAAEVIAEQWKGYWTFRGSTLALLPSFVLRMRFGNSARTSLVPLTVTCLGLFIFEISQNPPSFWMSVKTDWRVGRGQNITALIPPSISLQALVMAVARLSYA